MILDFAARLGLIGLGVFIWMQIAFWRTVLARIRHHASRPEYHALMIGLAASMVDFLTHGLVDAAYFVVDLAFVFMLTLALVQIEETEALPSEQIGATRAEKPG